MPYADLHLHTTHSDGTLGPSALIASAAQAGISVCAVTDHDILDGFPEAAQEGSRRGVSVVPGVELSSGRAGKEVHILGLFVDPGSEELRGKLAGFRDERRKRGRHVVSKLALLGVALDYDAIVARLPEGGSLGRPHLARALVEAGYVRDIEEAFDRFLGPGRPGYVARSALHPEQAIALVHSAGGLAFLAHPGPLRRDDWIPRLRLSGLDGIEALHGDHDEKVRAHYLAMAGRLDLMVCGGSDFHGENKKGCPLGGGGMTREQYETVAAAAEARAARSKA